MLGSSILYRRVNRKCLRQIKPCVCPLWRLCAPLHIVLHSSRVRLHPFQTSGDVGANAMSLEIVGPERLSVSRSVTVAAKGIQKLESSPVVGGKLEGCLGASISALLARVVGDCGDGGATG